MKFTFPHFALIAPLVCFPPAMTGQERGEAGGAATVHILELSRREAGRPAAARRALDAPMRTAVPPLPAAAAEPPVPRAVEKPALSAAPAFTGFAGLLDNLTRVPPDTEGAVGPQHVATVLNSEAQFQDRSGKVLAKVTLDGFWAKLGPFTDTTFDPRILYDREAGRWIASSAVDARKSSAALLVGASQTADPTGAWSLFKIDIGKTGNWADYPVLGFNGQWVVVSVNLFQQDTYVRTNLYVFDKAEMYRGSRAPFVQFSDQTGTFVPALDYDGPANRMLLAQAVRGFAGIGGLRLSEVRGAVGSETFTTNTATITVNDFWAPSAPDGTDLAPQKDSTALIDTGDARLQNCVYRSGSLWCVHTVFLPSGTPTRSAVQWWQVNPGSQQVVQRGRLDDPAGKYFYAFPSIAVNGRGDALVGFTRFSAAEYASGAFAFRAASDPPGTLQPEIVFKPGEAAYRSNVSGAKSNRWGDYSATVADPADDTSFWTIQQYAATPPAGLNGRWGTWWAHVVPASTGGGCTYTLSSAAQLFPAAGGQGSITVTTASGCVWSAASNVPWIVVEAAPAGGGTGTVGYTVAANVSGGVRTGTITVAGQTFTVTVREPAALPDVVVSALSAPPAAMAGGQAALSVTVRNLGTARAGAFRVGLYWTAGPAVSTRDIPATTCAVGGLEAGAQTSCSGNVPVPASLAPGPWYLGAIADDQAALSESDRTNNTRVAGPVEVSGAGVRPVSAASYQAGAVAPGEIVTFFGSGLGPATGATLRLTAAGSVATVLGETRVLFDGTPAPMIYAQASQVSAVVPFGVGGQSTVQVQLEYRGVRSAAVTVPVAPTAPAFFTLDASGRGPGAFLNLDGTVNSPAQPAARGSIVVLYATGLGQTDPPLADGQVPADAASPRLAVGVRIGGRDAEVLYGGPAPGLVAGVYQINVRVPDGVAPGAAVAVELTAGAAVSAAGVTLAVE